MRYNLFILSLTILIVSCKNKSTEKNIISAEEIPVEVFDCPKGLMLAAWYEHGMDTAAPNINRLKNEFLIWVDTNNKATNFISFGEDYSRERSDYLDTTDYDWDYDFRKLTTKEKLKKVIIDKKNYKKEADSAHYLNNRGQQLVWIINNSNKPVTIQMQDWSFICVLQAITKGGKWNSIQYWEFSGCGNSYYFKNFKPKTANTFIFNLPKKGNYKTKLRFKILGADEFFYSNEFDGFIDYCEFVQDSSSFDSYRKQPNYKLDTLMHLAWQHFDEQ